MLTLVSAVVTAADVTPECEADPASECEVDSVTDMSVHLIQSRSSLVPGLREALMKGMQPEPASEKPASARPAAGLLDSSIFTQIDVEPTKANQAAPLKINGSAKAAQQAEDFRCSAEGLTPGVCVIASLARPPPLTKASRESDFNEQLNHLNPERLEGALLEEIGTALAGTHGGFSMTHIKEVEESLRNFFASLPKNGAGRLDHTTVRYALHQQFVRRHSWYIRSLNPVGEAQTPASPGEALRGQVPVHLQTSIENLLEGRGLGLHELAVLLATLEHLIQGDTAERMKAAYYVHQMDPSTPASTAEIVDMLKTFMAHFLSLQHTSGYALSLEETREERQSVELTYDGWSSVSSLIYEATMSRAERNADQLVSFSEALSAAQEVLQTFETISARDCQEIKRGLVEMPNGARGEVLLSDIHKKALDGASQLSESVEYLNALGALSESERGTSVLVPNYVLSPSNCLGTTSFFDMCCPNECEVIMDKLEAHLRKPEAEPSVVYSFMRSLYGGDAISGDALTELDNLALHRNGTVALHGYHFTLWLHHAFPRECPRPRREDYAGARQDAEVPSATGDFQAVAHLQFWAAPDAEMLQEVLNAEEKDKEDKEPMVKPFFAVNASKSNASRPKYSNLRDFSADRLSDLAAKKLSQDSLNLGGLGDMSSFAQTRVDAQTPSEEDTVGLNVRRRLR